LALLVLKRANLAEDLSERLPFDPALLDKSITDKAKLAERPGKLKDPEDPEKAERKEAAPTTTGQPGGFPLIVGALTGGTSTVPDTGDAAPKDKPKEEEAAEESPHRPRWPWLLLTLAGVLLGTAITCVVVARKGGDRHSRRHRPRHRVQARLHH